MRSSAAPWARDAARSAADGVRAETAASHAAQSDVAAGRHGRDCSKVALHANRDVA